MHLKNANEIIRDYIILHNIDSIDHFLIILI